MKLILMMALTVDGKIAKFNTHYPDWTGSADKKMFKRLTQEAGVVIMGSRTYRTIGKPLPGRLNIVYTRHPEHCLAAENVRFTSQDPQTLLSDLASQGYDTAFLVGGATINNFFAHAHLIDEMLLTVAPKIFGQGLSLFSQAVDLDLELMAFKTIDLHTLLLHYRVRKPAI